MLPRPEQFATSSLRQSPYGDDICRVLATAIHSADAGAAIRNNVALDGDQLIIVDQTYDLGQYKRVLVIGVGKAAIPMATSIHEILGKQIFDGIVITKKGYPELCRGIDITPLSLMEASHPVPDPTNLIASSQLFSLVSDLKTDDLVICLLSGGGSALLTKPPPGITLKDLQVTTQLLLSCGAEIGEINTIRKHLDQFKGGGLAKLIYPATIVTLIISDVVGDYLNTIASGPTAPDPSTFQNAWEIFKKYKLMDRIPTNVGAHIEAGIAGNLPETPKPGEYIFDHVQNIIIGSNPQTAIAVQRAAKGFGFTTLLLTTTLQGEASKVGQSLSESAKFLLASSPDISRPACLIAGGETTVSIRGTGKGGRNQELALGAVTNLSGDESIILVSLATDGVDGPTDAAGAVVSNQSYKIGLSKGLNPNEYLANNDSYHYFEDLGDLIKTGPTLTNVNDLVFIFAL